MNSMSRYKAMERSLFSFEVKTAVKAIACAFVVCAVMNMVSFDAHSKNISDSVVRLHILASSDDPRDQSVKLKVRDEVQRMCVGIYPENCTKAQAESILTSKLPEIISAAQDVVKREGYDYSVRGEIVNMYFTTRRYGEFTLPAGNYDAVRITLGKGEGHNWWCVMYPPVCVAASGAKMSDVLGESEESLVTDGVVYKFKIYELYESLCGRLGGE